MSVRLKEAGRALGIPPGVYKIHEKATYYVAVYEERQALFVRDDAEGNRDVVSEKEHPMAPLLERVLWLEVRWPGETAAGVAGKIAALISAGETEGDR